MFYHSRAVRKDSLISVHHSLYLRNPCVCYVCIILQSLNIPEMSLEFSNNLIEFRTCVDTFAGLRDLMQYIASYGDLRDFVFVKAKSFDSCKDETESVDDFSTPLGSLVRKNISVCVWCV